MNATRLVRTSASHGLANAMVKRELRGGFRTRFAPAPTGFLHLGHVVNALHVWGTSRAHGGQVVLRIEDHDRTRCRAEYERALLDDLDWLGFIPDIGPASDFRGGATMLRQSQNAMRYTEVLNMLAARGLEYGCVCTRKDIAEIAGHRFGEEIPYPGTCAHANHASASARRFRVSSADQSFDDIRLHMQRQVPQQQCGDFLLRDRNGNFTYQFCVSVDDMDQDIDVIIRGEDLLSSTGRQLQLANILGRLTPPVFLHHQLLLRDDGLKLSKSLGDSGVNEMREAGMSAEVVLGRAAFLCGLIEHEVPIGQSEIASLFA